MTDMKWGSVQASQKVDRSTHVPSGVGSKKKSLGEDGIDEAYREPPEKWFSGDYPEEQLLALTQVSRETWLYEMGARKWRLRGYDGGSWHEDEYLGKHDYLVFMYNGKVISAVYYQRVSAGGFVGYYYIAPKSEGPREHEIFGAYTNADTGSQEQ